jgi:hypothetical protein
MTVGCSNSSNELTVADLAKSEGKSFYKLKISGAREDRYLGIRLVGRDESNGGSSGFKNGDIVKALAWIENDRIQYSLIGNNGDMVCRGSIPGLDKKYTASSTSVSFGGEIDIGKTFVNFHTDSDKDIKLGLKFEWSDVK